MPLAFCGPADFDLSCIVVETDLPSARKPEVVPFGVAEFKVVSSSSTSSSPDPDIMPADASDSLDREKPGGLFLAGSDC